MTRCGNHAGDHTYHANSTEVRACHQGLSVAAVDRETGRVLWVGRKMDSFDTDPQNGPGSTW